MDDVSIEFSVGDYGVETSVSSQKSSAESRNGRFFGAFRHDTKSSCFACMPNFALSSSTIGLDRQPETVEESNNKSTTTTDEESQHRNSSTLSNGLVTKKSTNETEQGSEHESSVAYADPFAQREGKTLSWSNVSMVLVRHLSCYLLGLTISGKEAKKDRPERFLLDSVWGEVPKTKATAIMGASGAGKTSLLNVLCGRVRSKKGFRVEAFVRLDKMTVDPCNIKVRQMIAFVAQEDSLQATATPRDALKFSAKLRLPRSTSDKVIDELVDRMIQELGLSSCANTMVGGMFLNGLSGGERKRTSIGVELIVKPTMVFLDEPTSGLDSFSAMKVCAVLKKVAQAGASVLFTIHQPSSEIFESCDHLILLQSGRVMHQGPIPFVTNAFSERGYPVPLNYNPADWVISVSQRVGIDKLEESGFFPTFAPVDPMNLVDSDKNDEFDTFLKHKFSKLDGSIRPHGLFVQVEQLFLRELFHMSRFAYPLYCRFGLTVILSILVGIIFFKIGETEKNNTFNLQSHFGALMCLLMLALLGTAQPALLFFPEERPIFLREYSTSHYTVLSYFISRFLIEAVITGAQVSLMVFIIFYMVKFQGSVWVFLGTTYLLSMCGAAMAVTLGALVQGNGKVAQQLLPIIFIPQILFSGFFVSPDLIPVLLRWVQYICVLTYAVRTLVVEEFHECSDEFIANQTCNFLVKHVKADPDHVWSNWLVMLSCFIFFRLLALLILRNSATVYY